MMVVKMMRTSTKIDKMVTTIQISDELWKELNDKKKRGETFEDVIWREIKNEQT